MAGTKKKAKKSKPREVDWEQVQPEEVVWRDSVRESGGDCVQCDGQFFVGDEIVAVGEIREVHRACFAEWAKIHKPILKQSARS